MTNKPAKQAAGFCETGSLFFVKRKSVLRLEVCFTTLANLVNGDPIVFFVKGGVMMNRHGIDLRTTLMQTDRELADNARKRWRRQTRQKLLDAMTDLFYREGFHAIHTDDIVRRSGVGKATLYRYYPTKESMAVACLEEKEKRLWHDYDRAADEMKGTRRERFALFIHHVSELLTNPGFRGCPSLNAMAELPENHPVHQTAAKHKFILRTRLLQLTGESGQADQPRTDQLLIILHGVMVSAPIIGQSVAAAHWQAMMAMFLEKS